MKYIDEFRNAKTSKKLLGLVKRLAGKLDRRVSLMEVCGTHTVAMFRHGIRRALPGNVRVISGPGCPVCVTSQSDIDKAVAACGVRNTIVTTFGDMIKVPGTKSSLGRMKAEGSDVRVVYSPLDALETAVSNPDKKVVFIAIGFETTVPTIAAALVRAGQEKLKNFYVICAHKIVPPALKILVDSAKSRIDGFLLPGHVSTIIGSRPYSFLAQKHKVPCVIAGFESMDILQAIAMLLIQLLHKEAKIENQYTRVVSEEGNPVARQIISRVFRTADAEWRGLGIIPRSGLVLKREFGRFDFEKKHKLAVPKTKKTPCRCGDVLQGIIYPNQCPLFGKSCTPQNPIGPCMVSSEGACAAYYRYGGTDEK